MTLVQNDPRHRLTRQENYNVQKTLSNLEHWTSVESRVNYEKYQIGKILVGSTAVCQFVRWSKSDAFYQTDYRYW